MKWHITNANALNQGVGGDGDIQSVFQTDSKASRFWSILIGKIHFYLKYVFLTLPNPSRKIPQNLMGFFVGTGMAGQLESKLQDTGRRKAKDIPELTDRAIRAIKEKGLTPDGKGLYLTVNASGAKSWVLRFMLDGKAREMGLGGYPKVGLADARAKRDVARKKIAEGVDPIEAKQSFRAAQKQAAALKRASRITFSNCVESYLQAKSLEWSNAKHAAQWRSTLEIYANPVLGQMAVADVDTDAIMSVLSPIWTTKTETASRLRGRIECVLSWAKAAKYRTGENPATWRGNLDMLLPKPSKITKVEHHPALPYSEINGFLKTLDESEASAARALELVIFTALRTMEVIGGRWEEIDLDAKMWTVPARRMKMKVEHRVPLSAPAMKLLSRLHATRNGEYIFPSPQSTDTRQKPLSSMAMLELLKRMKRTDITPHGFRSTFRDWAAEQTNFPREIAQKALAHKVGDETERAYQRGDLFAKRAQLMDAWAKYCHTAPQVSANVTPIGERKRKASA